MDAAASPGGRFLYVQTGAAGIVDEFAVSTSGALTEIGSVTVPAGVGGEGIAVGELSELPENPGRGAATAPRPGFRGAAFVRRTPTGQRSD